MFWERGEGEDGEAGQKGRGEGRGGWLRPKERESLIRSISGLNGGGRGGVDQ